MNVARWIIDRAARLMPPHRQDWAEAMRAEFTTIPASEAMEFAMGCLWTAIVQRISLMKAIVTVGRWSVGLVTMLYGALFLMGCVFFSSILFGHAHDRYYDLLLVHHPEAAAQRLRDYPWLLAFTALMASSHIIAGIYLINWRPRQFIWACLLALTGPAIAVIYGIHSASPIFISFLTSFIPWVLLVMAATVLWWLGRGASRPVAA